MECQNKYDELLADYNRIVSQMDSIKQFFKINFQVPGEDFFNTLVKNLHDTIEADYTFIGKIKDSNKIRTISFFGKDRYLQNFTFDLENTPSYTIVGKELCIYENDVQNKFPKDKTLKELGIKGYCGVPLFDSRNNPIGIIACLFKQPIINQDLIEIVLMSYARWAGSEIEHQVNYQEFNEIKNELIAKNKALKKSETTQVRLNQRTEFALMTGKSAWFEVDFPKGTLTYNQKLVSMLDLKMDHISSFDEFISMLYPDDNSHALNIIRNNMNGPEGNCRLTVKFKSSADTHKWFRISCQKQIAKGANKKMHFVGLIEDISTEKDRQIAKDEMEHCYHQLIDNFPNGGILLYDRELRYQLAGGPKLEKAGLHPKKIIGKSIYDIFPQDICDIIAPAYINSLKGEETQLEVEYQNAWHSSINVPYRNLDGEIVGGIVVTQNITKQRTIREQLRTSQSRYQSLLESTQVIAWELNLISGNFVYISPQIKNLSGYESSEWTNIDFWVSILHEEDRSETLKYCLEQTKKAKDHRMEYRIIKKGGQVKWISDIVYVDKSDHNPQYLRGFFIDITKQKEAEIQLKISEQKFSRAFHINPDAISISKLDGTYVEVNEGFTKITGYTSEEAVGKKTAELGFYVNDLDQKKIIKGLTENGSISELEVKLGIKNGKKITGLVSASIININEEPHILRISRDISAQKLIEQKLKLSEEKFRKAFYTNPDAINLNTLDGTYVDINFGFQSIMGYTQEDVIGKKSADLGIWVNPEDRTMLVEGLLNDGYVANLEAMFRKKSGELITGLMSASLITHDHKQLILSVTRDISDRILTEKRLKYSEQRYHTIIESAYDAIFIANCKDGIIIDVNERAVELLGLPKDKIIGLHQSALHPPEIVNESTQGFIADVKNTGKPIRHEDYVQHSSGAVIPVEILPTKIVVENGRELIVGFFRDISERIEAKKALEESFIKYKTIADYNYDWEFWRDVNSAYIYVSPSCHRITGYNPERFVEDPNHLTSIIHKEDLEIWKHHEKASANQIPCPEPLEFRIIRSDGEIRWISHVCQPVYDQKNTYIGTRGSNRDISTQKLVQLSLAESESKYRLLFENMTSGFALHQMIYDKMGNPIDYTFLEINPAFEKLTGLKREEVIGKNVREIMPATEAYWINTYGEIAKSGNSRYYENFSVELGKYFSTYVFSPDVDKFAVVFYDITEKKKIEDELVKSENKLKLHLAQTPLGVIEWGMNSEILSWNKAAEKIFGYSYSEIRGEIGIKKLVPQHLHETIKDSWVKTLEKVNVRNINKNLTKDGRIIICEWYNTAIVNNEGNVIGVISMVEDVTNREKTQKELRKSKKKHKMISQISSDFVYSMRYSDSEPPTLDWVSGAITRITGYTVEQINALPEKWNSIIYPDDNAKLAQESPKDQLAISKSVYYRIITKNGSIKWISDTFVPIQSKFGKITGYIGSIIDVTEKKEAEENLKATTSRLQSLAEISEEGIIIHDNFIIIEASKAATKITGYSENELLGVNFSTIIHPDDLHLTRMDVKSDSFNIILRAIRKDGTVYHMEIHSHPIDFQGKNVNVTSFWDVTNKVATEKELKQNQDYLKQAQKIAHIGHFYWDVLQDTCFFSEELKNIYEIDDTDYAFRDLFYNFIHADDKYKITDLWNSIEVSNYKFDEEFRIITNRKTKWLRAIAEIHQNENGEKISVLGLCLDVTEQKLAEQKIHENASELMKLNTQIANYKMMALRSVMNPHFIFNCLNSIQFFIAKNEKKPAISYLSLFSKLMRNVLSSSVERYVTLTKEIETLEYYIELEKLRFDDNFDFILEIEDDIDPDMIEIPSMVIQPYVENAIIHGLSNKKDTGKLIVKLSARDNLLLCTVEDDGIGRKAAMKNQKDFQSEHKSYGMTVTQERLNIINKTDNVQVEIIDLVRKGMPAGTRVNMIIELNQE